MGTATAQTQVTAERLGLPMDKVQFCHGDSHFPGVVLAGGSQQTASIGSAVMAAQHELVKELLKLAGKDSPLNGLKPEHVAGREGGLGKPDEPERFDSYAAILERAGGNSWWWRRAPRRRRKCSTGPCIRTARCSARCA